MSIFTNLFKARNKSPNRIVGNAYRSFLENSTPGKLVTERVVMQMTDVYSCMRILVF